LIENNIREMKYQHTEKKKIKEIEGRYEVACPHRARTPYPLTRVTFTT